MPEVVQAAGRKQGYYDDGITRMTDPFWTYTCILCGKSGWSLTYMDHCPKCSSKEVIFTNPNIKISPSC